MLFLPLRYSSTGGPRLPEPRVKMGEASVAGDVEVTVVEYVEGGIPMWSSTLAPSAHGNLKKLVLY